MFLSFVAHFQALIADNLGILALSQVLIADSFGLLTLLQVLIAVNFGALAVLALFQALLDDNFGIFNTLGKNKYHPGLETLTSGITSHCSTKCASNSLVLLYIKRDTTRNTGNLRQETCDRRRQTGDVRQ